MNGFLSAVLHGFTHLPFLCRVSGCTCRRRVVLPFHGCFIYALKIVEHWAKSSEWVKLVFLCCWQEEIVVQNLHKHCSTKTVCEKRTDRVLFTLVDCIKRRWIRSLCQTTLIATCGESDSYYSRFKSLRYNSILCKRGAVAVTMKQTIEHLLLVVRKILAATILRTLVDL